MSSQAHIVFMNFAATGHMNPTLPVVAELRARGCEVTYFVSKTMRDVVEAAGATWRHMPGDPTDQDMTHVMKYVPEGTPAEEYSFPAHFVADAAALLPEVLGSLRALKPPASIIVYDPVLLFAPVAAHALGLPTVGMVTVPGPGTLAKPDEVTDAMEANPWVRVPRAEISRRYGVDVFERGLLMEMYSPLQNIVTTIDDLFAPPLSERQRQRLGGTPFTCIGALMDVKVKRVAHARAGKESQLPTERLSEARSAGKRVVYVSLGTIANSFFWSKAFGELARSNGLAEVTGKDFIQHVFRTCFEALGDDESIFVVMAVGPQEDALVGLPSAPANFALQETVPQLEMLQHCDAFVTHGGANSMHEALGFGVPLAVVPMFGDQPGNADSVARVGAGIAFPDPLKTLTAPELRDAILRLLDADDSHGYRAAAREMARKLTDAGGVPRAAETILEALRQVSVRLGGA